MHTYMVCHLKAVRRGSFDTETFFLLETRFRTIFGVQFVLDLFYEENEKEKNEKKGDGEKIAQTIKSTPFKGNEVRFESVFPCRFFPSSEWTK